MLGRKKHKQAEFEAGRTMTAERERMETESEREQARKKVHRRHKTSLLMALLVVTILGLLAYLGGKELFREYDILDFGEQEKAVYEVKAKIVDESGQTKLSSRMREYIGNLEEDLRDLGYTAVQFTLPMDASRELYVDLEEVGYYFKVSVDRGAGVTAEDMQRMVEYLQGNEINPEYVDVRIGGKAYYK